MLNKSYKTNTMQLSFIALSLVFSLVCFKMCISSKNKQHSKYQADDITIVLPGVTMVLAKTISNRPMANGDTAALAIYN